jgi:hypothetical protein
MKCGVQHLTEGVAIKFNFSTEEIRSPPSDLGPCNAGCTEAAVYLLVVNQNGQSVRAFAATAIFLDANTNRQYPLFAYTENPREFHWSVDGMNLVYGPNAP